MKEIVKTLPSCLPQLLLYGVRVFVTVETDGKKPSSKPAVISFCTDSEFSDTYVIPIDTKNYKLIDEEKEVLKSFLKEARLVCFNQIETGACLGKIINKDVTFIADALSAVSLCTLWNGDSFFVDFMNDDASAEKNEDDGFLYDLDDIECLTKCGKKVEELRKLWTEIDKKLSAKINAFLTVETAYGKLLANIRRIGIKCMGKILWSRMRSFKLDVVTNRYNLDTKAKEAVDINSLTCIRHCVLEKTSIQPMEHTAKGLPSVKNSAIKKMLINERNNRNEENASLLENLLLCQKQKIQWKNIDRFTELYDRNGTEQIFLDTMNIGEIPNEMYSALVAEGGKRFIGIRLYLPEIYLLALAEKEMGILKAYNTGLDVMKFISSRLFRFEKVEEVADDLTQLTSDILERTVKGLDIIDIVVELKKSEKFVKDFYLVLADRFPMFENQKKKIVSKCKSTGVLSSFIGRKEKRLIVDWNSSKECEAFARSVLMTKTDLYKLGCLKLSEKYRIIPFNDFAVLEVEESADDMELRTDISEAFSFPEMAKPITFRCSIKRGYDIQSVM